MFTGGYKNVINLPYSGNHRQNFDCFVFSLNKTNLMSVTEVADTNSLKSDLLDKRLQIDLNKPRWDQSTFLGRLRHFAAITDVRKAVVTNAQLDDAKDLVDSWRSGAKLTNSTEEQLWRAKHLYDSAFHPDSGDKMNLFGRMSFQVPGGMAITGLLLQFYQTPGQVALMQWLNQSFNALVNYTNRNAASSMTNKQMIVAYVSATTTALGVALGLNFYSKTAPPIVARWVPFAAVASANAVNIPLSRQNELISGVQVMSADGKELGYSKKCARKGIGQVLLSRVFMAAPGMIFLPMIMVKLDKKAWFRRATWFHLPFQTLGVGAFLLFTVPTACAFFPQHASMSIDDIESDLRESIRSKYGDSIDRVYFNKGL